MKKVKFFVNIALPNFHRIILSYEILQIEKGGYEHDVTIKKNTNSILTNVKKILFVVFVMLDNLNYQAPQQDKDSSD